MTIRQLIHSGPAKANELFARLAETSDGAVKTRERLFSDLKAELELLSGLEEKHLVPVLRKHKETKDLVAAVLADNKQVRALLGELDRMPKEGQEFPGKLAELRKAFQQHVRDEKRELLPAVSKALSEEEAQTVVERIETGKAEAEETKREVAEQQRAEARREREKAEAEEAKREEVERQRAEARREREKAERQEAEAAERRAQEVVAAITQPTEIAAQGGLRLVEAGGTAATAEVEIAAQSTQGAMDLAGQTVRRTAASASGAARSYHGAISEVIEAERSLAGFWLELASEQISHNVETMSQLARARAWQEAFDVQNAFVRASFDRMSRWNERYLETVQIALGAASAASDSEAKEAA